VEHLQSDEDLGFYLEACFDEDPGDGSLIRAALGDIARARGMAQLARDTGLTREGLYKALSPEGNPEFSTVVKVINALGLRLHAAPGDLTMPFQPWTFCLTLALFALAPVPALADSLFQNKSSKTLVLRAIKAYGERPHVRGMFALRHSLSGGGNPLDEAIRQVTWLAREWDSQRAERCLGYWGVV
jgi:probable addiction module antidote protein